jgi:hypothetical protein
MTQQHTDQDTQVTAVILKKDGKRTTDGNNKPYYEFTMQPLGSDFSRMCRQFDNLEKGTESGDIARTAKEGDTVTFMEFLRPASGGGNYHNVRRMVSMGAAPAGNAPDPDFDDVPAAPAASAASAPDPDFDTPAAPPVVVKNPQRGFQKEATRYIAGNSQQSISIERQVSMKAAIDLMGHKANLVIALVNSGMAQTLAPEGDSLGLDVLNAYWGWVCENGIPGEAHNISEWLEYDSQGEE